MKNEEKSKISKVPLTSEINMALILLVIFIFSFEKALDFRSTFIDEHDSYFLIYGIQTWFLIRLTWFFTIFFIGLRFRSKFIKSKEISLKDGTYFKPKHIDVLQFAYGLPIEKLKICVSSMLTSLIDHYNLEGTTSTLVILITKEGKKANFDSDEIAKVVSNSKSRGVEVIIQPQGREVDLETRGEIEAGKRGAWVKGLNILQKYSKSMNYEGCETGLAVFDGDSQIPKELSKTFFRDLFSPLSLTKKIVATTIHNHTKVDTSSNWTIKMFNFRFLRRYFIMSAIPNVLTGRASAMLGIFIHDEEFKKILGSDLINHYESKKNKSIFGGNAFLFPLKIIINFLGVIVPKLIFKTVTGDDKSTIYYVFKKGYKIIFNPLIYVICHEDLPSKTEWFPDVWIFQLPNYAVRYCRNTLNNNSRLLNLGYRQLGLLRYLLVFNDRYIFWSPLVGLISLPFLMALEGVDYFWVYFSWIIFSRSIMTMFICYSAGERWSAYYPVLLYNDHTMIVFVKLWALVSPISNWTRQNTVKIVRRDYYLNIFRYISLLLIIFCTIGVISGVLKFDNMFIFFQIVIGGKNVS